MTTAATTGSRAQGGDRNLQQDVDTLRGDIAALRDDVAGLASGLLGYAKGGVTDATRYAKERGTEVAETIEEKVHEHPLATIGIAFGVGLVVGALARRS